MMLTFAESKFGHFSSNPHVKAFSLGMLIIGLAFAPTWYQLFHKYATSGTYAHGFLIFPLSAWMIYQNRHHFSQVPARFEPSMLWGFALLSLGWLLAAIAYVTIIKQLCLILMVIGLFVFSFGRQLAYAYLFPLCYLLFAIPFGNFLTPYLQDLTALFAVKALELSQIPVYFEGLRISTTSGDFLVAEACSGIRYLIATLALGMLFAYITYDTPRKRVLFCLCCLVIPLIANGARAYLIILIAHKSNMKYAVGVDHLIYGWLFFGLIIFILFSVGSIWKDPPMTAPTAASAQISGNTQVPFKWIALFGMIMSVSPVLFFLANTNEAPGIEFELAHYQPWQGPAPMGEQWQPSFIGATIERQASYRYGKQQVDLYMAIYQNQRQNNELISESNRFYDHRKWSLLKSQSIRTEQHPQVAELMIQTATTKRLVWYVYAIDGHTTTSRVWGKILEAWRFMRFSDEPGLVMVISCEYDIFPSTARATLSSFMDSVFQPIMEDVFTHE